MCISITQYRICIGLYNSYKIIVSHCSVSVPVISLYVLLSFLMILLILAGDVHENPGPFSNTKNATSYKVKLLSLCHVNIRSLTRAKLLAIKTSLIEDYDIITLSDTFLHQNIGNYLFAIAGFHDILRRDRDGHGGGVAMYIKNNIAFKRMYEYEVDGVEAIWVSVLTTEGKILICNCYRPPDRNDFWDSFDLMIDTVKQANTYKYIFILGDINADLNSQQGNKLRQFCISNNLDFLIKEPTRITATTQTVLDQILTNALNFVTNVAVSPPISTNDHCTVSCQLNFKINKKPNYHRNIWLFNNVNFNEFRHELEHTDFNCIFDTDDVDIICSSWSELFMNVAKRTIPNKSILVRPNDSPWYNANLRLLKRKMLRLFHKFKSNKTANSWEKYKDARNHYQYSLDLAEETYKNTLANSLAEEKNSKRWWTTVKSFLGRGSFNTIPPMQDNNTFITDSKDKADCFNRFFLSHTNVDTSQTELPNAILCEEKLCSIEVTEQEVTDLLKCINTSKATGPDGIGPKLLKEAGKAIVPSLTKLFNLCLQTCKFPKMWKHGNILPLYKKGDKSVFNNYRPVSLLSCTSKLLEKIVFKNVFNYIRDNNILTPHQSGFRPGDSTTNQLAYLYHTYSQALDFKKDVRIAFFDISKAFDRVWFKGLLFKLRSIGIGGNLLSFFQNYLTDRYQSVVIDGQSSSPGRISSGVPQGSVLGPLLFLIYINDLTVNIRSNIKLFADDTSLFIDVDDPQPAADIINEDLATVKRWADQWLVNFSPEKTKLMTCTFRSVDHPPLIFDNKILTETNTHKHLGLTLTSNLSWSLHIDNILKSVSQIIDVLKSLKYILDKSTLEKIYFSFIRPKLEYGNFIFDNCSGTDSDRLEGVQLDVARIVTGARKGTSHALIMRELGWPSLTNRRKGNKLKQFLKILTKETPEYLQNLIPAKIGTIRPQSRNPDNFYYVRARTETFRNSFIPSAVRLWNSLSVKDRTFTYCKEIMKQVKFPLFYHGGRVNNIKHAQLRMLCSKLNHHLFLLHVVDSPTCNCGSDCEDNNHFLLQCPLYFDIRRTMLTQIRNDCNINITVELLLFGAEHLDVDTNCKIFDIVHKFIEDSNRL